MHRKRIPEEQQEPKRANRRDSTSPQHHRHTLLFVRSPQPPHLDSIVATTLRVDLDSLPILRSLLNLGIL